MLAWALGGIVAALTEVGKIEERANLEWRQKSRTLLQPC